MRTKSGREIFSYWNDRRGSRTAPARADIDPSAIRHLLPDLFVLTQMDDASLVFRLTGTRLYNLFHRDLRDNAFNAMWQEDSAGSACRIAQGVMERARPVLFDIQAESATAQASQEFEMLLLPLAAQPDRAPRLLGALVSDQPLQDFGQPFAPLTLRSSRLLEVPVTHSFFVPPVSLWTKGRTVPFWERG